MRKNFLLLAFMALLPLLTWAMDAHEDYTDLVRVSGTLNNPTVTWADPTPQPNVTVQGTLQDFTWVWQGDPDALEGGYEEKGEPYDEEMVEGVHYVLEFYKGGELSQPELRGAGLVLNGGVKVDAITGPGTYWIKVCPIQEQPRQLTRNADNLPEAPEFDAFFLEDPFVVELPVLNVDAQFVGKTTVVYGGDATTQPNVLVSGSFPVVDEPNDPTAGPGCNNAADDPELVEGVDYELYYFLLDENGEPVGEELDFIRNVGTYSVWVRQITPDEDDDDFLTFTFNPNPIEVGQYTVTRKALTIYPSDFTIEYGMSQQDIDDYVNTPIEPGRWNLGIQNALAAGDGDMLLNAEFTGIRLRYQNAVQEPSYVNATGAWVFSLIVKDAHLYDWDQGGIENYALNSNSTSTLTIDPADFTDKLTFDPDPNTFVYDGTEKEPDPINVRYWPNGIPGDYGTDEFDIENYDEGEDYITLTPDDYNDPTYENNVDVTDEAEITLTGKGNYTGEATEYFSITPSVFSEVSGVEDFVYNTQVQIQENLVVTATVVGEEGEEEVELTEGEDYVVAYYEANDDDVYEGPEDEPKDVNTYAVVITGIGNYEGAEIIEHYDITPKDIAEDPVQAYQIHSQSWTGAQVIPADEEIKLNYVTDAVQEGFIPLVRGTGEEDPETGVVDEGDFTVEFGANTKVGGEDGWMVAPEECENPSDVYELEEDVFDADPDYAEGKGGYAIYTGHGNYKGQITIYFPIEATGVDGIEITEFDDEEYDGTKHEPETAGHVFFTYPGEDEPTELVEGEDYEVTYGDDEHDNISVGTGVINFTFIGDFAGSEDQVAEFNITPVILTITANSYPEDPEFPITYGSNLPTFEYTAEGWIDGDDESLLKIVDEETGEETDAVQIDIMKDNVYVARENAGTYDLVPSFIDGFELDNYEVVFVPGTLVIGAAPLYVTIDNNWKIYGDPDPEVYTYTVEGLVYGDTREIVDNQNPQFQREEGEDVIVIYDDETGEATGFDGYPFSMTAIDLSNYVVQFEGKLTIYPKPLETIVNTQYINFGDEPNTEVGEGEYVVNVNDENDQTPTVEILTPLAFQDVFEDLDLELTYNDEGIVAGENEEALELTCGNTNYRLIDPVAPIVIDDPEQQQGEVEVIEDVLPPATPEESYLPVYGTVVLEGGPIFELYTSNKAPYWPYRDTNYERVVAFDGVDVEDVKIFNEIDPEATSAAATAPYVMVAERWYTMVLPFEAEVADISRAFGYAVVDVLDQNNTAVNEYYFLNTMGVIPANTPFILRIDKDINLTEAPVYFYKGNMVRQANGEWKLVNKVPFTVEYSDDLSVTDAAGNIFCGTYSQININVDGDENVNVFSISDGKIHKAGTNAYLRPLGAYMAPAEGGDIKVFIEEEDGTITAIESVAAEAEAAGEGWYTISGVKLAGKPTVKGVYIYNGQKVTIQ